MASWAWLPMVGGAATGGETRGPSGLSPRKELAFAGSRPALRVPVQGLHSGLGTLDTPGPPPQKAEGPCEDPEEPRPAVSHVPSLFKTLTSPDSETHLNRAMQGGLFPLPRLPPP